MIKIKSNEILVEFSVHELKDNYENASAMFKIDASH